MNRNDRERAERRHRERAEELHEMLDRTSVRDRGRTYQALATAMQAHFTAAAYYASLRGQPS